MVSAYIVSQIVTFFSVTIFLRLTFFPPGGSPDWAITLGYGSLLIAPLILTRHSKPLLITTVSISVSWIICRFTGNDLILPIVTYFSLAFVSGWQDQRLVPVLASIAAVYTAFLAKAYGVGVVIPDAHMIVLNLLYATAVIHTGSKVFLRGGHEEETAVSDSYENYREAA